MQWRNPETGTKLQSIRQQREKLEGPVPDASLAGTTSSGLPSREHSPKPDTTRRLRQKGDRGRLHDREAQKVPIERRSTGSSKSPAPEIKKAGQSKALKKLYGRTPSASPSPKDKRPPETEDLTVRVKDPRRKPLDPKARVKANPLGEPTTVSRTNEEALLQLTGNSSSNSGPKTTTGNTKPRSETTGIVGKKIKKLFRRKPKDP